VLFIIIFGTISFPILRKRAGQPLPSDHCLHYYTVVIRLILEYIGADFTGATGNFAPVLTQEPGQTLRFAPVLLMAVL